MTKITLIAIVNLENINNNIFDNNFKNNEDFELKYIKSSSISKEILKQNTSDEMEIIGDELNNVINESNGEYILFTEKINSLSLKSLNRIYDDLKENNADLLILDQNINETTLISRIVGTNIFNYRKIRDHIFSIDYLPLNYIYKKEFLENNNINYETDDFLLFTYKSILKAERILYTDKLKNKQIINQSYDLKYFKKHINNLDILQEIIIKDYPELTQQVNNFIIKDLTKKYENNILYQKEIFELIRKYMIKTLQNDKPYFINSLNDNNRKTYEQIIISESVEEYELLKKIAQDKKHIDFMKRYEKILKVEYEKISSFNKSLISSNSWKLTKFLRIKNKIRD